MNDLIPGKLKKFKLFCLRFTQQIGANLAEYWPDWQYYLSGKLQTDPVITISILSIFMGLCPSHFTLSAYEFEWQKKC